MSTLCYLTFPANEIKTATDSVFYAVANYVIGKFPQRAIKQLFVDTQDNMRDFYKNAISSYAGGVSDSSNNEELLKTPRPHLFVGYQVDANFESTDNGLGETQPYMFPNAFWFQQSMQSQHPILHDTERDVFIGTNNLRIRATAEFVITCKSREEQFTLYNYLINVLKFYYTMPILGGVEASFILPNYMMQYLKDILYGEETKYETIAKDMDAYLKKWSNGGIYPVYRNNKENDKFYEMKYIYNRVDFKMSGKPQMDDGSKSGDAADNFTVRFPATVEFYIPTNYTVRVPELIPNCCGGITEIPDAIKLDYVNDEDLNDHIQTIIKVKNDNLSRESFLFEDGWTLVKSVEFAISEPCDEFNLFDVLTKNEAKSLKYLIDNKQTDLFKMYVYEDRNILDYGKYYTVDDDFNVKIKDGNVQKTHTLELYFRGDEVMKLIEKLSQEK